MSILEIVFGILLIISSILIITVVMFQDSKQSGLSVMTGTSDSYLSKNKGRTLQDKLITVTKIFIVLFFVVTIAVNLILRYS